MLVKETGNIKVQIKFKLAFLSYCSYYKRNSSGLVIYFKKQWLDFPQVFFVGFWVPVDGVWDIYIIFP